MILYTSGTTSLPKGVLSTHANIQSQISTLVQAWEWSQQDHTLCLLPLHHVHGIINVVSCALWSGATVQFLHPFDAARVFQIFMEGNVNVFMAVPTIYFKLISHYEALDKSQQESISDCLAKFRLMVSGSAALPVSVMDKWQRISGHYLLERYGMTEIGMAISNPLHGQRKAGYIGKPLPGVGVRICDENDRETDGQPGEIQIKGPAVFREYWGKPEATRKSFTTDGWFKTGDIAVVEDGYYRILGRDSVDIIKSGGYKISALEIEEILRTHPEVKDCAVVGIPNEEWGELVAAAVIADPDIDVKELNAWMREKMPAYKTPRQYKVLSDLPRNAMGKVTKNELKNLFQK
jgi:malonyl-CoA/methylmalonyl-CoA synthetase